jgi:hypothetical protein
MINNTYAEIAVKTVTLTQKRSGLDKIKCFDPFTIITIISIIIKIIECYLKRKLSTEQAVYKSKKPNFLDRMILRKIVKTALDNKTTKGYFKEHHGRFTEETLKSLLECGKEATSEKLQKLADEYKSTLQSLENNK